jgi:hypothetical protein
MAPQDATRRLKTWSVLGDVRRKPTPYEVVTARFHYHFRRQPAPFELDPQMPLNRWYLRFREGSSLQLDDWEGFRDPHKLTYRTYIALQHERETVVDGLIDEFERLDHDAALAPGWVSFLARLHIPLRFPVHALQMTAHYVGQMAPSSFVTNCAFFQAADELRRVQWIAYRAKSLSLAHGDHLASSEEARRIWEEDDIWQPLRETVERMLVTYDWGESFVALNLAVKPAFDELCNRALSALARQNGDHLLALVLDELNLDAQRSREWTEALVRYTTEGRAANRDVLQAWVDSWLPRAYGAVKALAVTFAEPPHPEDPTNVLQEVAEGHRRLIERCGLAFVPL